MSKGQKKKSQLQVFKVNAQREWEGKISFSVGTRENSIFFLFKNYVYGYRKGKVTLLPPGG